MRARRIEAAILALAVIATSLAVAPDARSSTGLPGWTIGDYWSYVVIGPLRAFVPLGSGGTLRYVVAGVDTIGAQGSSFPAYRTEMWTNESGSPPALIGSIWYRTSDLAVARWTITLSFLGFSGWSNYTETSTAEVPAALQFPLVAGANWTSDATVAYEHLDRNNGTATWSNGTGSVAFSVGADQNVAVPAGTFMATPLTENETGYAAYLSPTSVGLTVTDFSAEVGNAVKVEADVPVNGGWKDVGELRLVTYGHAEPGTFLGLSYLIWGVFAGLVVTGAVGLWFMRRRGGKAGGGSKAESSVPEAHSGVREGPKT